jgi:hypothetical protein
MRRKNRVKYLRESQPEGASIAHRNHGKGRLAKPGGHFPFQYGRRSINAKGT